MLFDFLKRFWLVNPECRFFPPIGGGSISAYEILKSLRFRSSASAYLSRTFAAGSATWTLSMWVKRGSISGAHELISYSTYAGIQINAAGNLVLVNNIGGTQASSAAVLNDPAAFYHIVVSNIAGTVTCYVNNAVVIASASLSGWYLNTAGVHAIGNYLQSNNAFLDGYISEANFVDGQAYTPAYFGYLDTSTNSWRPKKYTGTYGTNGFYLPFNDGTNLTTLGQDRSGNGNNWTCNNISLTAGATYDWMDDTPTNNYCVLSPLIPGATGISSGNLSSSTSAVRATMSATAYASYWEVTAGASNVTAGVIDDSGATNTTTVTANKVFAFRLSTTGDLDYRNITDAGSWTSITTGLTGNRFPYGTTAAASWNFGQRPFTGSVPSGYSSLCTKNLPEPGIAAKNPKAHFDVVTQLGSAVNSGANLLAQFTGLSAGMAWGKDRTAVNNHQLVDVVRGNTAVLQSNTTAAETTYVAPTSGDVCVAFGWKAGGAAVANNAGSIASQVSANQDAGFSIVTYTGTGANGTVGHGLGVAPKLIICKVRDVAGNNWVVWHGALGGTDFLRLNTTDAKATASTVFNGAPTSSVFNLGTDGSANSSGKLQVAYCFAEIPGFSKIASYTGNGLGDGVFVYCGFRPRWILVKQITAATTTNWIVGDTERDKFNLATDVLLPNTNAAEDTAAAWMDIVSNGFKFRSNGAAYNGGSGATYVFYAIAEQTLKYANAR